jgi:hypothetical protein
LLRGFITPDDSAGLDILSFLEEPRAMARRRHADAGVRALAAAARAPGGGQRHNVTSRSVSSGGTAVVGLTESGLGALPERASG